MPPPRDTDGMDIKGKTAIVTGASRGLGFAVAQLLARAGANLVIAARGREALERARSSLREHVHVEAIAADVSLDADSIAEGAIRRFGGIDIVVNNASELGPSPMPALADLDWRAMERILRVNVTAPLHLVQLALPSMRSRGGGTIVSISSDAGVNAYPGWGGYGASKAALEHCSRTLAAELDGDRFRVIVVDPGDMDTQMHRDAEPGVDLSHLARPEDVAPAIVGLIADDGVRGGRFEAQALLAKLG